MKTTLYHNPHCTKSRATLKLLQEQGLEPSIINYLETPPSAQTLDDLLEKLSMQPRDLLRKNEKAYTEQNLADPTLSREALIQAMLDSPSLIERPILVANGKARIGRPPKAVLEIL